jgi:adenylylsulfate kinase-like enzyme
MKNKIKGLWFIGLAGSGKTFASKYLDKKIKNNIIIDGDEVRKKISYDLGYSLSDRTKQIRRMLGIALICIKSKKFPIISTVLINNKILKQAKKNNIKVIKIEREMKQLKKVKKIYKNSKNVVGKDISFPKIKVDSILNTGSQEFKEILKKILNDL